MNSKQGETEEEGTGGEDTSGLALGEWIRDLRAQADEENGPGALEVLREALYCDESDEMVEQADALPGLVRACRMADRLLLDAHDRGYAIREVEPVVNAIRAALRDVERMWEGA
jgi:hypothetical protein